MSKLIQDCKLLKAKLDSLRPIKKEDEIRIMQKFRLDWNYHSNHLEGNSLTYGETKALILHGITAQGKPLKDHFEVTGHNDAISWVLGLVNQDRQLSENFVRELHALILKESYEVDAITPEGLPTKKTVKIGEYKTTPNHVKTKTGEIFRFTTPEDTPIEMSELIDWYNQESVKKEVDPILLASKFHYRYIRIHPFDDGNGRTARIIMNFILLRFGYPPVIIKTEDKNDYFASLQQADVGIIKPFFEYIAKNLKHSLEIMIAGAKGESIEEKDDIEKEISLLEQSVLAAGRHIKLTKNKENLLQLFEDSISPAFEFFRSNSKLMDRFYNNVRYFIEVNRTPTRVKGRELGLAKSNINIATTRITFVYNFERFKNPAFAEFDYQSKITFDFNRAVYKVRNEGGYEIEKLYGENLSQTEIEALVNGEIQDHKDFIQQKVEELRNE